MSRQFPASYQFYRAVCRDDVYNKSKLALKRPCSNISKLHVSLRHQHKFLIHHMGNIKDWQRMEKVHRYT